MAERQDNRILLRVGNNVMKCGLIFSLSLRYLEQVEFADHKNNVCFITPDVGQFIKLSDGI